MSTYYDVLNHGSMIFDHVRNHAYEKAILAKVNENSVVLDLGSGLGLHGLMAAKAGAKKVYLVDPSPTVILAGKIAKANGLDNVECIQSRIEDANIEKVDLIISVFTGNFLLTEDLLPSLFYARDKFLKPNGLLLPDRAKMIAMPVSSESFYQSTIGRWKDKDDGLSISSRFGLSYQEVTQFALNNFSYDDFTKVKWTSLAPQKELCDLDFYKAQKAECFQTLNTEATSSGDFHGWLGWFDMMLAGDWLSTSPMSEKLHWSQVFIPVMNTTAVSEGDGLYLDIKRPEYGDWTWKTSNSVKTDVMDKVNPSSSVKSQSTFLSAPLNMSNIQKKSPSYQASISTKGEMLKELLTYIDGKKTNEEIAAYLLHEYPDKFEDLASATSYLHNQIAVFC